MPGFGRDYFGRTTFGQTGNRLALVVSATDTSTSAEAVTRLFIGIRTAGGAAGTITWVQDATIGTNANGSTISTTAFATNPTIGNYVIVWCWAWASGLNAYNTAGLITCSDNMGTPNIYTQAAFKTQDGNQNTMCTIFYTKVAQTGAGFAPVVTGVANSAIAIAATEFSGIAAASPVDGTAVGNNGNFTSNGALTIGNMTVTAGDLVCAVLNINDNSGEVITKPAGWTQPDAAIDDNTVDPSGNIEYGQALYQINPSSPTNPSWTISGTWSGTDHWSATQVAFLAAPGGGDTSTTVEVITDTSSHPRTTTDTSTSAEAITRLFIGIRTSTDVSSTVEVITDTGIHPRTTTDISTTADVVTRLFVGNRSTTEAITSADVVTRLFVGLRTTTDSSTSADVTTRLFIGLRTGTENVSTADSNTDISTRSRTATEALSSTDVVTRLFVGSRTTTESPLSADIVTRIFVGFRTTGETPSTIEDITRLFTGTRTTTDVASTSDVTTRLFISARTTTDISSTADLATRMFVSSRTITEAPSSVDVVTRLFVGYRTSDDVSASSEVATASDSGGGHSFFVTAADTSSTSEAISRRSILTRHIFVATSSSSEHAIAVRTQYYNPYICHVSLLHCS